MRCEKFEEMLSALQDGELEEHELPVLEEHLEQCAACRRLRHGFAAVDRLVSPSPLGAGQELKDQIQDALAPEPAKPTRAWFKMAVAALVLIASSLVILVLSDQADAGRLKKNAAALAVLNQQAFKDQEIEKKTLEWDLDAMQLMINSSNLDGGSARPLLRQIDELRRRLEKLEKNQ